MSPGWRDGPATGETGAELPLLPASDWLRFRPGLQWVSHDEPKRVQCGVTPNGLSISLKSIGNNERSTRAVSLSDASGVGW
jgi:hypothetical protein